MFRLFLYAVVSLRTDGIDAFPARPSGLEEAAWFVGCANASDASVLELHSTKGVRDLDPAPCCALCLNEGYQIAALTPQRCLCSSHLPCGLVFTQCFHASSSAEGERQSALSSPAGGGQGTVALHRTKGPFLRSVSVSASPRRVEAGETSAVEAHGNLAGGSHQPTVHFTDTRSQSSHLVNLMDDGSIVVPSDWICKTPGQNEIIVRVSNRVSTLSSSLQLFISPDDLLMCVLHGPLGVLSCPPFIQKESQAASLCDPVLLQAAVRPAVSHLKESVSETQLSEYVELFAATKHLLVLNLPLKAKCNQNQVNSINLHSCMDGNAGTKNSLPTENTPDVDGSENCDNKTHNVCRCCSSIYLHSSNRSGCHLHLRLSCLLVTDNCPLSASLSSTAVPFSLVSGAVESRTPEERDMNVSGCYNVTVQAFRPVSRASLQTHILVRDPAGERVSNTASLCSSRAESEPSVSVPVNAALLYRASSYSRGEEAVVVLLFNHTGTAAVELGAENRVYTLNKSMRACIEGNRKQPPQVKVNPNWQPPTSVSLRLTNTAVRIHAAKRAYPTNADVTLAAVSDVPGPVEFVWHFGDSKSARTTARTVTKRYTKPGRFDVVVVMSAGRTSVTSNVLLLEIQRAVRLNRLVHQASVLQNHTATVSCQVSAGTNLTFLWSFGDGSSRPGQSTEHHVFHRTGEFRISVVVSNLISSASLSSHAFVVDRPCQPPPVKNMGPLQLQVWRYEAVRLGVTYENEVDCDVTGGLRYTWTLVDSAGQILPLPSIDTHRQSLILPAQLLHYGVYVAIARVQVVGSVVYSNYSVRVNVRPSPPVAFIQGGTNIFINSRNTTLVSLDGQRSHDPDFPLNPLSYSWTCKPVSSIPGSCFRQHVATSSPVLTFPVAFLKRGFDQFHFTLAVHSGQGERSASSEAFLTLTPTVLGKVLFYCRECKGDQVNWDQPFSVGAWCEACDAPLDTVQFTWSLYVVNASSRPVTEIPFCEAVDLNAPSAVFEGSATSPQVPPDTENYAHESTAALLGEELLYRPPEESGFSKSTEYPPLALDSSDGLYLKHLSDGSSEFPNDSDSSPDWGFSFPVLEADDAGGRLDYDVLSASAEEGDPGLSPGRPTGVDGETFSVGEESEVREDEGSNLVDSRPSVVVQEQTLLDLPRDPVDVRLFESYTYTGTSSSLLSLRPFSLRPGSRYMLEVTAESHDHFLGRSQLFLKTRPAPKGVMCQVQPVKGKELHTHFSVFCASGKEDLVYEYSFSVGGRSPRMLYQGRDFQYYFRLPSGDPSDDYKVTIYIDIRSAYGTGTKPCPVTVQVQPSFLRESSAPHRDPALELSESGLRNLSALVRLGDSTEVRNYVSLLSSILNRLSLDTEASAHTHTHIRSALISTLCKLESSDQQSMQDNICVLKDVVRMINQVSYVSARRVVVHVQAISDRFLETGARIQYNLDYKTLNGLITLLSYTMQAAINQHVTLETPQGVIVTRSLDSGWRRETTTAAPCVRQLVADIHRAASDLMLKYIISHEAREHRVSAGPITLYATYQNSTVVSSGSAAFYMPASLMEQLPLCVLSVLTEFTQNPYTQAPDPTTLSGPVVSLNLYKCGTRRKIHIHSSIQPISVELQHPQNNMSSVHEYVLHHNRINYHSFNITQEHLQQAIQFSVVFKPQRNKVFPVMLLFRMFDRPTPSLHHLHRIHRWESNTLRITLPPSYLSAAGSGHLALLNAGKAPKHRHLREQISYSLTGDSSLCLSWDAHRGSWTHRGCRPQQADTAPAVGCSCHQLQPLTVVQHHLEGSHDTADLDPFVRESGDLTLPAVLLLLVCLYILGLVLCRKADVISGQSQQVHSLPDNSPSDPHLYAVTIHTGLSSAACMSAKVYIVLYGEGGRSQTRELQVPGCTLFRRNSQDTFVLSAADSLGPVWGLHIWHDNSGPSPDWYLGRVAVSEVKSEGGKGRLWLFVGQCWLSASKGDGQVEKMLHASPQGMAFATMLRLTLSDYMADFHIWMSVLSCPCPTPFTHTQRLTVSLLLLLGYSCVNTVIISQMNNQLPFELGMIDVSVVSVTTGILSVLAVLPPATVISFLFRCREVRLKGSGAKQTEKDCSEVNDIIPESHPSWTGVEQHTQGAWSRKYQADVMLRIPNALTSGIRMGPVLQNLLVAAEEKQFDQDDELKTSDEGSKFNETHKDVLSGTKNENQDIQKEKDSRGKEFCAGDDAFAGRSIIHKLRKASQWCHCLAWALCVLLSLSCLVLSAVLGMRFSSSKVLLWIHSLFFSLMSCVFIFQPLTVLTVAVVASLWYRKTPDFHHFFCITELETEALKLHGAKEQFGSCDLPQKRRSYFEELLRARRRARYLRLVRPPAPAELRKPGGRRRRGARICNSLRDLSVCVSMLFLLCISSSSSFRDHYQLNMFVRRQFVRNHDNEFMLIQKHKEWWKWMQTSLLDALYKKVSEQPWIVIGEPVAWKMEPSCSVQVSEANSTPAGLCSFMSLGICGPLDCYPVPSASVGLGQTKSDAASSLRRLRSDGWLNDRTLALKLQFTLYSPAPNLFTSVMLVAERSGAGVLLPSAKVQSVRAYHTPAVWDYVAMTCQLFFLLLSLLQLCHQVKTVEQQGLMGYCRSPFSWLEMTLLTVTLVHYIYCVYHSVLTVEVVELLQRHNYKGHVDVSSLASCEHDVRTLRGVTLFLLTVKCVTLLRTDRTTAPSAAAIGRSLSSLFWPLIAGLIHLVALSCVGNLRFAQTSRVFSSVARSLQTLLFCCWGLRPVRGLLPSGHEVIYGGVLYLCSIMGWTAVMRSVVSSVVRRSRRCRGRGTLAFTATELGSCIRQMITKITLQRRPTWTENHMEGRNYYLEEFEGLIDELLLKLNALSISLHPQAQCYAEEGPVSPVQSVSSVGAQDFVRIEMIDETKREQSCRDLVESASLIKARTEKRAEQWTQTKKHLWIQTRATCTEVVVEALVHKEPEIVASPEKKDP